MTSAPGLYGTYGGRYVPETLIPALDELEAGWRNARADESFTVTNARNGFSKTYKAAPAR